MYNKDIPIQKPRKIQLDALGKTREKSRVCDIEKIFPLTITNFKAGKTCEVRIEKTKYGVTPVVEFKDGYFEQEKKYQDYREDMALKDELKDIEFACPENERKRRKFIADTEAEYEQNIKPLGRLKRHMVTGDTIYPSDLETDIKRGTGSTWTAKPYLKEIVKQANLRKTIRRIIIIGFLLGLIAYGFWNLGMVLGIIISKL